jgi:biopolymer transport protein ExbB/TolQ
MAALMEFLKSGGWEVWLILFIGIAAFAVGIERFIVLYFKVSVDKDRFVSNVQRAILAGDLNSAVNYCNERSSPMSNIIKSGIIAVMNRAKDEEVQTSMDVAALREIPKIERRTPYLALLGNIATLCGLFATIIGLIESFQAVAGTDPAQKATMLAGGISKAMNGTALGLVVAIPALLASAVLISRTQRILDDVHEVSVSTLNMILSNRDKFPSK